MAIYVDYEYKYGDTKSTETLRLDPNRTKWAYEYKYADKNVTGVMKLDLRRFKAQYSRAQCELDSMVMKDMVKFMPMDTGTFINVTKAMSAAIAGSGKVVAAAPPFGRFLYEGKVMVGVSSGSPWAQKAEKKVVTDRDIDFYKGAHPDAQAHWFDAAKKQFGSQWVKKTKKIAGGG